MPNEAIKNIAVYRNDVVSALQVYFSDVPPNYQEQFLGISPQDVAEKLNALLRARIEETDLRSALAVLTSLEAAFRIDYKYRLEKKVKGNRNLLKAFRDIRDSPKRYVRLDGHIFEAWERNAPGTQQLIRSLRSAFNFRDWLAHGGSWVYKGRKYDFDSLYDLAANVLASFDFVTADG
ncbi:MAG: hypothetical protein WA213_01370 [Terriglobales bacterium]